MIGAVTSMKPLLVARGVSKRFGAVEALVDVDVDFDCRRRRVADRISVLRLGRHVATFDRRATARADVVAAITGALSGRAVAA